MGEPDDVYIHAMWRTGSTFLISRFRETNACLDFYEPFHEEVGRQDMGGMAARRRRRQHVARQAALNHPEMREGYFVNYALPVAGSDMPLYALYRNRFGMGDVYRGLSDDARQYLVAASRLARLKDRRAVFGFCRSGLQLPGMTRALRGEHIYLYRDPRSQFASYRPGENDYFMPMTLVQLLAAERLHPIIAPVVAKMTGTSLIRQMSRRGLAPRLALKLARPNIARLSGDDLYRLFYTSWLVCNEAGRMGCDDQVSLAGLARQPSYRQAMEERFSISLTDLKRPPERRVTFDVDYAGIESEIETRLSESYETVLKGDGGARSSGHYSEA